MKRILLGDSCIIWSFGDTIDIKIVNSIAFIYKRIKNTLGGDYNHLIFDIVPSYNKIAVHFNKSANREDVINIIESIINSPEDCVDTKNDTIYTVNVMYNGCDLDRVSSITSLSIPEIINLHTSPVYTVAMVGFQPNFPFLCGLDPKLTVPRLDTPRLKVPAKSVAIGGIQTGIYPSTSPGGWNLIGTMINDDNHIFNMGDLIKFKEVV